MTQRHGHYGVLALLVSIIAAALALPASAAAEEPGAGARADSDPRLADVSSLGQGTVAAAPRKLNERSVQTRIVGGSPTAIEAWPWQVALTLSPDVYGGSAYRRMFCGGTLVAPTVVVTAAHCLYDPKTSSFTHPSEYAIVSGRTKLSSGGGQEIPFATYQVLVDSAGNPIYDHGSSRWDLAIVQLARPSSATPIQIAGPGERSVWAGGAFAFVTGWGSNFEGGSVSDVLHAVQISIIDDSRCSSIFSPGEIHLDSMLCAGFLPGGKDACQGDSGGPLVVPIAGGGFRLVGDTSWGYGCAQPGNPGVYGRLAEDPMRSVIRRAALAIAGVDVVGSGAQPALSAPAIPSIVTPDPDPDKLSESACSRAERGVDRAKKRLRKAKRKLRRARANDRRVQKSRRKVVRAKRKLRRAKVKLVVAC